MIRLITGTSSFSATSRVVLDFASQTWMLIICPSHSLPRMADLSPEFLSELLGQIAFLSAVLGGFSVTFLATILVVPSPTSVTAWVIGAAGVAAAFFIAAAVSATGAGLAIQVPEFAHRLPLLQGIAGAAFAIGIYAFLVALGACGWVRSRRIGIVTTVAAGMGAILVTLAVLDVGT
jgi:hypothetical protein